MTSTKTLLERNARFAASFDDAELPIIPNLRSVILACTDARVDPAHIFGLELGDSVVMRNNGARLTPSMLDEVITLSYLVDKLERGSHSPFEFVLVQHTKCGAERFADPDFRRMLLEQTGVDVAASAIEDHHESLREDVARLRDDPRVPGHITVAALLYDVDTGTVEEVVAPVAADELRATHQPVM